MKRDFTKYGKLIADVEVLPRFFLLKVKEFEQDKWHSFELSDDYNQAKELRDYLSLTKIRHPGDIIIFKNGRYYDDMVLGAFLMLYYRHRDSKDVLENITTGLKQVSDLIILNKTKDYQGNAISALDRLANTGEGETSLISQSDAKRILHHANRNPYNDTLVTLDIEKVGLYNKSLKLYEVESDALKCDEYEYSFNEAPSPELMEVLREYCKTDVINTERLVQDKINFVSLTLDSTTMYQRDLMLRQNGAGIVEWSLIGDLLGTTNHESISRKKVALSKLAKSAYKRGEGRVFYPNNDIPDFIRFKNPDNQKALDHLRGQYPITCDLNTKERQRLSEALGSSIPSNYYIASAARSCVFDLDGRLLPLGLGGIHYLSNITHYKGDVGHCDVSSYYPFLLLSSELAPVSLNDAEKQVFRMMYADLLKTKMNSKTMDASEIMSMYSGTSVSTIINNIKLKLNSTFGKTRAHHSWLYSAELTNTITIMGQLMMMMLIERLSLSGFRVVCADTDGVEVIVDERRSELEAICSDHISDLDIDEFNVKAKMGVTYYDGFLIKQGEKRNPVKETTGKSSSHIIRHNYKDTEYHRSGYFKQNARDQVSHISIFAVCEKYFKGVPIEQSVSACNDLRMFVRSKKRQDNHKKFALDGIEIPNKIIRYIFTDDGRVLTPKKKDHLDSNVQIIQVVNDWSTIPSNLDRNRYIKEAEILEHILTRERDPELMSSAKTFMEKMVIPIGPKGSIDITKESLSARMYLNASFNDFAWERFNGYGGILGPTTGFIAFDIDDPDRLPEHLKILFDSYIKKGNLVAHHIKGITKNNVVSSGSRFSIVFKYQSEERYVKNLRNQYGFEVLYHDGAIVQFAGIHDDGNKYKTIGTKILDLPDELIAILNNNVRSDHSLDGVVQPDHELERIRDICIDNLPGGASWSHKNDGGFLIKSLCPSNPDHDDFTTFVNENGSIGFDCFHTKCEESNRKWMRDVEDIIEGGQTVKIDTYDVRFKPSTGHPKEALVLSVLETML